MDIAALRVAKACGIDTGGWMPKGFKTLAGPKPAYAMTYGMLEHESPKYNARTFSNVHGSDATLRLAHNFASPGEICTLKAILQYERPYYDVLFELIEGEPHFAKSDKTPDHVRAWLVENKVEVLNVAGNSGEWFEPIAEDFLDQVFSLRKLRLLV